MAALAIDAALNALLSGLTALEAETVAAAACCWVAASRAIVPPAAIETSLLAPSVAVVACVLPTTAPSRTASTSAIVAI